MVQSIPSLVLLIAILVILGPSLTNVIIALSVQTAFVTSRVMRASALTILGQPFVDAGRVIGASHLRIMSSYILPNIMAAVIVLATVNFGRAILAEAFLAFLGYSVPPPQPSYSPQTCSATRCATSSIRACDNPAAARSRRSVREAAIFAHDILKRVAPRS
jgi:peptide/nickel transport system permease protein